MLRSIGELRNYVLEVDDGQIGRCSDFLFDDTAWTIRYMVADTGKWLPGRKVLVSPASLGAADWESKLLSVALTRSAIEESPPIESDAPVSKEHERRLTQHYNLAPYWYGGGVWGLGAVPQSVHEQQNTQTATADDPEAPSHNLRSVHEVTNYHIQAKDGAVGHVEDFIVDDDTWTIRYIVVDTRNWLPGRKVLISPMWANRIDWSNREVHVDLSRDLVKNGPEFDPSAPVNREYESRLYDYYGRPKYWD
jgi:hypothetical protein